MRLRDHYPIIVTAQKEESRDFWQRYLGVLIGRVG